MMTLVDDVSAGLEAIDCVTRFSPVFPLPDYLKDDVCDEIYDKDDNKDCCEDHFNLIDGM